MGFTRFLFRNLDAFRARFFTIFIIGIFNGAAAFLIPVLLAEFTKGPFDITRLQQLFIYIIIIYAIALLLQRFIRYYGEALAFHFGNYIREKYFIKFQHLPVKKLQEHHSGYRLAVLNRVADSMGSLLMRIFWVISQSIATIILFFYFTARESFFLAILNMVILTIFVAINLFFAKKIAFYADNLNKDRASLLEKFADLMSNLLTIKKLGIQDFTNKIINIGVQQNKEKINQMQRYHAKRWLVLHIIWAIAFLSTIFFFLYQIAIGKMTVAILILFLTAFGMIKWQMEMISEYIKDLLEIAKYIETLEEVANYDEKRDHAREITTWKSIQVKDICYTYDTHKKPIIIPYFSINKGEKVCITGKSGIGKTTLLNILGNWIQPQKGIPKIGNIEYSAIDQEFFTKHMTFVSQETELFNMSIEENITLGKQIEKRKLLSLMKEVDLDILMEKIHNNLSMKVGEKGIRLSSGEKQRMNLLRAILLNKDIYLLDEPTSHLDANTEKRVLQFLGKYLKNKTVIIVSHRPAVKAICDRVYEMQ